MENTSAKPTPMSTTTRLEKDDSAKSVDHKLYRSMIASLLYLTASRPDIMMSVCLCARFQANPKESHLRAVKCILRYLTNTKNFGLFYPKECPFELVSYSDTDFGGSRTDRKAQVVRAILLENHLYLGLVRSKIAFLFLHVKQNIFLLLWHVFK